MRKVAPLIAVFLSIATLLRAEAPPAVPGLEALDQNGRSFQTSRWRLPLRVYDSPGLLGLPADEQAALLDRVADAGFNAVSFETPLVGHNGLSPELGKVDDAAKAAWTRTFEACQFRRLYAFPVLWTPATVDALIGTATARDRFFAGKNALGWQAWALRQAAAIPVKGQPLSATAMVGGWLLYRGPWPDGPPLPGRVVDATPTAEARLRAWARWQVMAARRLGYRQCIGLGLYPKQDVGQGGAALQEPVSVDADADAPFAPISSPDLVVDTSVAHSQALDILPPVPGADAEMVTELDDSAAVKEPPANPWDLEGLVWDEVEELFATLPLASQIDFIEFTLDTEDWYRVGDRLAEASQTSEVPILWRQDWRTASRYERNKRLAPPAPLAGLEGGWPDEDWPDAGNSLWSLHEAASPETAPFRIRNAKLATRDGKVYLSLGLNRPANVIASFGKGLPLDQQSASKVEARPKAEHELLLKGVKPGAQFLLKVQALSPQHGTALMRTRWARAPK